MGGQACVFYGAAQVSKDIDFLLLADEENFGRFRNALDKLKALRIAVPRFNPEVLARGHAVHFHENRDAPTAAWIEFWLKEARSPDLLIDLATLFPVEIQKMKSARPLLTLAINNDIPALRIALDTEIRAEQEKDRIYWEPLKREMEAFRREERTAPDDNRHHGSET
jgi:hypothetical protein